MIFKALALTSKIMIPIATSCASCGLIVGVMSLTGFGERLSYGITAVANGNLFVGLAFTAVMCIIIGMGLPTLAAYIVLATLGVPALTALGAPVLGAHLFVFYCAILSAITPPVALSAFVGAGIAGANPIKVGFTSMALAPFIYVLPFMFVFYPGLLFQGSPFQVAHDILFMIMFMFPVIIMSRFYWLQKLNVIEVCCFGAAIVFFFFVHGNSIFPAITFNIGDNTLNIDNSFIPILLLDIAGIISHLFRYNYFSKWGKVKTV
jgi:TRAP-type uncharacterized transport system fused permease subunit